MGCSHAVFYVSFILVWFLAILRTTDAVASVTWYEPPPVETVTNSTLIETNNIQLREGSINEPLNWNFSLTQELNLILVAIKFDGSTAATIVPSTGVAGVDVAFTGRFNISWISQYATLTIFNVMVADEGVFSCELNTFEQATNRIWKRNIQVTVVDPPSITDISGNQTVTVGDVVTLICTANGRPTPNITWTRLSDNSIVTFRLNITGIQDEGTYRCTADNGIGNPVSRNTSITVQIPSKITNVSSDEVVCEDSPVTLSCNATGKPTPNITWTRVADDGTDSAPLLPVVDGKYVVNNIMRSSNGTYRCTADNGVGHPVNRTVRVTVRYSASVVRIFNSSNTVNEGGSFSMTCDESGDPTPNVHWITKHGERINGSILNLPNVNRNDTGRYKCEVKNECGNDSRFQSVDVYYLEITKPQASTNEVAEGGSIECQAKGNPSPEYVWTNSIGEVVAKNSTLYPTNDGNYTCTAKNDVGSVNRNIPIEITRKKRQLKLHVEEVDEKKAVYQKEYSDPNSGPAKAFNEKFEKQIDKVYANDSKYNGTEVTGLSNGSVIVSFVLYFTTPVTASEGLAKLKAAIENGTLGPFKVGNLEIIQNVNPTSTPSVLPTGSTTVSVSPEEEKETNASDLPLWIIIVAVVGGVVVMVVIIAVVAWCVHKKRKCRRKGTKIHSSESDVALEGQVNGGYADSGPPSANGANRTDASVLLHEQPTAAAPPTYAVVDKKKKKEKKKKADKKEDDNVAKQDVPDYAVVDKSKKTKKKEEVEDAYAQVDMSKKSKKKPKPGEMLYADLGEFQQRDMPAVSTSPAPLPPIKRPPAYEETQYADITQFMKGEATLPDTNNSQGTEMTSANVEGGKEKPENTANEGGKEEKPKETRM